MNITRRLFARMAPVMAATPVIASTEKRVAARAASEFAGLIGERATIGVPNSTNEVDKYTTFRKVFLRYERERQHRWDRRAITGDLSPDILALRSVSSQHKARMLAADYRQFMQERRTLQVRLKQLLGMQTDGYE